MTIEVVKCALRQSKEGLIVSFVIHPSDAPSDLVNAPIGQRYYIAYRTAEEVETEVGGDKHGTTSPSRADGVGVAPALRPAPSVPDPAKAAVTSCAIRCRDHSFQDFIFHEAMKGEIPIGECGQRDDECARLVRIMLKIDSRAEIGHNDLVRARWKKLEAAYLEHAKLLPEQRG